MKNIKTPGHIALLIANIIFGLNNVISRTLAPDIISPFTLSFLRMAGAMILFWLISLFTKKEHVPPKDILLLALASVFGLVFNQMPFIVGLSMTSPIDASMVVTLLPIISMILAAIFIKEPITLKKVLGVVVGASGALILILHQSHGNEGSGNLWGNLIILGAVFSYSIYLTLFKDLISRYRPVTLMKWMFLFATIVCLPFCYKALVSTDFTSLSAGAYLRLSYVVICATFITYFLIPIGQKVLRPTTVSMYNYMQPVTAALVTVALGLDTFGWDKVLSGILVFTGVYFVTTSKSKAQLDAEKRTEKEISK